MRRKISVLYGITIVWMASMLSFQTDIPDKDANIRVNQAKIITAECEKQTKRIPKAVKVKPQKKHKTKKHKKPNKTKKKADAREVELLAKLIYSENGSSKYDECLVLTGVVVLKRVKAKSYPNTIYDVISQRGQYATWIDGKVQSCIPDKRCMKIAKKLLETDIADKYPDNLVFQSEFFQGKLIYRKYGYEYFCLT